MASKFSAWHAHVPGRGIVTVQMRPPSPEAEFGELMMKSDNLTRTLATFLAEDDADILGWFLTGLEVGTKASLYGDKHWESHPSLWISYESSVFVIWIDDMFGMEHSPMLFFGEEESGSPIAIFEDEKSADLFAAFLIGAFRTKPITDGPKAFAFWGLQDFNENAPDESLILIGDTVNKYYALMLASNGVVERLAVVKDRSAANLLAAIIDGLLGRKSVGRLGGVSIAEEGTDNHAGVEWIAADVDAAGEIAQVHERLWAIASTDQQTVALLLPGEPGEPVAAVFDSPVSADSFILFFDQLLSVSSSSREQPYSL